MATHKNPQPTITIGVDANEANLQNRVGSNVYAFEILKQLEKQTQKDSSIHWKIYLNKEPVKDFPEERAGWQYQIISPAQFSTQWALPIQLWKDRRTIDLFFTLGHYAPRFCPVPYVSCVMDLAFLKFPTQFRLRDLYQLKQWTRYSVKHAQQIVTISQSAKHDIQEYYNISPQKITVAYPGFGQIAKYSPTQQKKTLKNLHISKPYILYVGTLQPRKNLVRLIKSYEQFVQDRQKKSQKKTKTKVNLVIAGKIGWKADRIVRTAKNSLFSDHIVLTDFVTEKEKAVLYQNAEAVTLIGLYEGFGMPPLEALAYGKVPVVSDNSSLPEVVGKAGILVDPYRIPNIAAGLKQAILLNKDKSAEWKKHAKKQVDKFRWEKSGEQVLQMLKKQGS